MHTKDPGFAGQQRGVPLVLGRKLEGEKPFREAFWNEVKWEEELNWAPGDLTAWNVERKWASDCWASESKTGWACGTRVASSMRSQVPAEADVHLPSGSQGCLGVLIQTEKHFLGCKLPVASCFHFSNQSRLTVQGPQFYRQ